jgi:ATP-dependent Clp endopeptidase proteolytic subunit ClpP
VTRYTHAHLEAALQHGVDLHGRKVFLYGDVGEETIRRAISGMYLLSEQSQTQPIELYVASLGGTMDDAFALHDVTRTIKCPVHTVALGKCMSAAPLLVACGHPGARYATENTMFMLHDVRFDHVEGRPAEIEVQVVEEKRVTAKYAKLLARYTKRPASHWAAIFNRSTDKYFTAEEAVKWGLVDAIWAER